MLEHETLLYGKPNSCLSIIT